MGKSKSSTLDEFRLHPVMCALSKARAALELEVAVSGGYAKPALRLATWTARKERDTVDWWQSIAEEAIEHALDEVEAEFRKSLTPEQAHARVIGGPTAVS